MKSTTAGMTILILLFILLSACQIETDTGKERGVEFSITLDPALTQDKEQDGAVCC